MQEIIKTYKVKVGKSTRLTMQGYLEGDNVKELKEVKKKIENYLTQVLNKEIFK